jgi:sugar phosphate isomerase/epimerase
MGQPLRQALRAVAAIGAQGVQLDARADLKPAEISQTGRRELLHLLEELGLTVGSVSFATQHPFCDEVRLDARLAAARSAMELAWHLKARVFTVRIGRVAPDADTPEFRHMHAVLSELARHGNHLGVTPAVAASMESIPALVTLVDRVASGRLGVDFDPAAVVMAGGDPPAALRALHAAVVHFTARDGAREIDGTGLEVEVGRGEVDWLALLPLLTEIEYEGWINVTRTRGADLSGDVARAVSFLKQVGLEV